MSEAEFNHSSAMDFNYYTRSKAFESFQRFRQSIQETWWFPKMSEDITISRDIWGKWLGYPQQTS